MAQAATPYSFTERKRIRKSFGKRESVLNVPYLLTMQRESYVAFLQKDVPPAKRKPEGLQAAFLSAFPITSHNGFVEMKFLEFNMARPAFDVRECQQRGLTYAAAVRAKLQMIIYDRESHPRQGGQGDQGARGLHGRSAAHDRLRLFHRQWHRARHRQPAAPLTRRVLRARQRQDTFSGKLLFSARIIPYRGSWLDFEFDPKDILYFRVDRRRKMPVTILLKAIGLNPELILAHFFVNDNFRLMDSGAQIEFVPERLRGEVARFDITDKDGKVVVEKDKRITARHVRQLEQTGTGLRLGAGGLPGRPHRRAQHGRCRHRRDHRQGQRRVDRSAAEEAARRRHQGSAVPVHQRAEPGRLHQPDAGVRRNRRPARRARGHLPHDAPRRAADRRRGRSAVPPPVLQRRHLRPEPRRAHEVQRPRRPRRARRRDDAEQRGHPRRRQDPRRPAQRQRRSRRHRPPGQPPRALRRRTGREPVPQRPGAHREGGQGAPRPGRDRSADAARPDQLQADHRGAEGILRRFASCRSSWTRPTR